MSDCSTVRDASKAASIWKKIYTAVKAKGGSENALDILDRVEGAQLVDVIADILIKAERKTRTRLTVKMDYTKSLEELIAAGNYDSRSFDITASNFPPTGNGRIETELVLVHFNRDVESGDVIREMEQMGLEPAKIEHLLTLGAKHPNLQRKFPIIAPGSLWTSPVGRRRYVPCLDYWKGQRCLATMWFSIVWHRHCRFAAVRKS